MDYRDGCGYYGYGGYSCDYGGCVVIVEVVFFVVLDVCVMDFFEEILELFNLLDLFFCEGLVFFLVFIILLMLLKNK